MYSEWSKDDIIYNLYMISLACAILNGEMLDRVNESIFTVTVEVNGSPVAFLALTALVKGG